mmetsp:Transcript_73221/g.101566  ORF Transcript_73221/g.101566 Transcript_73221/m.101566 type:complete len:292 (+) Transcript_73221:161-1036(+)
MVTPGGGPRVLDEPVVLTVLGTGTDSKDGVVELSTATGGENTRMVGLESASIGLNGDGERSLVKSRLHLAGVVGGDKFVVTGTNDSLGRVVGARTIFAGVSVVRLELELVRLGVLESVLLETTVATVVTPLETGGAVNELLLGERDELSSSEEVSTLKGTGGGESPAGTALTLILDTSNGTLVSPVNGGGVSLGEGNELTILLDVTLAAESLSVFILGHIGEHVVTVDGSQVHLVEDLNGGVSLKVVHKSELEFLAGGVGFAPSGNVLHEFSLVGGNESDESSDSERSHDM